MAALFTEARNTEYMAGMRVTEESIVERCCAAVRRHVARRGVRRRHRQRISAAVVVMPKSLGWFIRNTIARGDLLPRYAAMPTMVVDECRRYM